jgi:hypothetical protein
VPHAESELVLTGTVSREDVPPERVASDAMRAMLCGLRFSLEDGVLTPLQGKEGLEYGT